MRIAIASRIFEPEASAASFRLRAIADALVEAGHDVTVLTVRPPESMKHLVVDPEGFSVKRAPVLRDKAGYVRGYVQYMSFDIPLFFRLLFSKRFDYVIVEPPPTTGTFVRLASLLKRFKYSYYAADIWSDASSQTGAPAIVVKAVRAMEIFALKGAKKVFSVSGGVTSRLAELGLTQQVVTIGNGVAADSFAAGMLPWADCQINTDFVYAGTASEWHGAAVFIEALPAVVAEFPECRVRFIGGGSERDMLESLAEKLGVSQHLLFEPTLTPETLAPVLQQACATLGSVRPGAGYDFAFPTKLYSAAVCGGVSIFSGAGPARPFLETEVDGEVIGTAVEFDADQVASAMLASLRTPASLARRARVAEWAQANLSLDAVARTAVKAL